MKGTKAKIKWGAKIWAGITFLYFIYLVVLLYVGVSHEIAFLPRSNRPLSVAMKLYYLLPMGLFFVLLFAIPFQIIIRSSIAKARQYSVFLLLLHGYALLFEIHILNWNLLVFGLPYFTGLVLSMFLLKPPKLA